MEEFNRESKEEIDKSTTGENDSKSEAKAETKSATPTTLITFCQRCKSSSLLRINMGFKVCQSEFRLTVQDTKHESARIAEMLKGGIHPGNFFACDENQPQPFRINKSEGDRLDARIVICLSCGQAQGNWPTHNPLECHHPTTLRGECDLCYVMSEDD
jgi:hypothetical protein